MHLYGVSFLFSFFIVVGLEIWATGYVCVVRDRKKEASVGRQWRQTVTQATTGRNRAATKRRWWQLGTQSISLTHIVPPQGRKKWIDMIQSAEGCWLGGVACCVTVIKMFTSMLNSTIKKRVKSSQQGAYRGILKYKTVLRMKHTLA